ncbi:hypothetical protein PQI07_32255 [Methylobacterium sp. 092160098-2]|uniref:hypothetical protein n=1 Tax=Methylobacterium sp. 092160098-2 TaxID=3025129 RepID=UPI002381C3A9|nr:hypothetical protein [Methylobacterium sp. 092160098-2]MDE4915260.1 hypothetical protein [Methylobacterium sp. 092160098-2]
MPFRATLKKLIRRDATAPSLRERAAELRGSLTGQTRRTIVAGSVAAAVPQERAEYRARLLAAYTEERASRPIGIRAEFRSIEERASDLVVQRCFDVAREVVALPPPTTIDGLALAALAAAILTEANYTNQDPTTVAAVGMTRAALAFSGASLPPGFVGFGDEPDHKERDTALHAGEGSLPAWAIAQAEAERAANEDDARRRNARRSPRRASRLSQTGGRPCPLSSCPTCSAATPPQTALDAADRIIAVLDRMDRMDGDADHEDSGDAEPSLAAPKNHTGSQAVYMRGSDQDRVAEAPEPVVPGVPTEPQPVAEILPWRGRGNVIAAAGATILDIVVGFGLQEASAKVTEGWPA